MNRIALFGAAGAPGKSVATVEAATATTAAFTAGRKG
jgi:hypothetical protein